MSAALALDDHTLDANFDEAAFGAELDALRAEILDSLGAEDAAYIRRLVTLQRRLDLGGRALLLAGVVPPAWLVGTALLSLAKILENMEIGHNVMHAQWDWMRDPEIHSTSWEWDNVCPATQWKRSHNHHHHVWTNVRHKDRDIGYGVLRMDPEQPWKPAHLANPLVFVVLAGLFEYGVGFHDVGTDIEGYQAGTTDRSVIVSKLKETGGKIRSQVVKDYVAFPALALPFGLPSVMAAASGALVANLMRNVWSFAVIFCGHFPADVSIFDEEDIIGETRGQWYRRQVMGSANFTGGPLMHLLTGNLDHQIEHHLFPDLPSNRYVELAPRVREICDRYGVPYSTGTFARQFGSVVRKAIRLSVPW